MGGEAQVEVSFPSLCLCEADGGVDAVKWNGVVRLGREPVSELTAGELTTCDGRSAKIGGLTLGGRRI